MNRRDFIKFWGKAVAAVGLGGLAAKVPAHPIEDIRAARDMLQAQPVPAVGRMQPIQAEQWVCFSFYPQHVDMGLEPGDVVQVSRDFMVEVEDDGRVTECMLDPRREYIRVMIDGIEYEANRDGHIIAHVRGKPV